MKSWLAPLRPNGRRTIYNIYTVVSALFRDAKLVDLIEQSVIATAASSHA